MNTDPQSPPRDRLFALIASIPGSGTVDWRGPARALLDEIAAAPVAVPPADPAAVRCPSCEHETRYHDVDDRCWFTVEQGVPGRDAVCSCLLRRLAAETPGPETQAAPDSAPLAKVVRWVTSEVVVAKTEFGDGYRAAQRDIRDLVKGRFNNDPQPTAPAVVAEPGKEA